MRPGRTTRMVFRATGRGPGPSTVTRPPATLPAPSTPGPSSAATGACLTERRKRQLAGACGSAHAIRVRARMALSIRVRFGPGSDLARRFGPGFESHVVTAGRVWRVMFSLQPRKHDSPNPTVRSPRPLEARICRPAGSQPIHTAGRRARRTRAFGAARVRGELWADRVGLRLSPPTSGLVRRGRRRGALPWPGVCFTIFHSPASQREAQLCSVTGPNTI